MRSEKDSGIDAMENTSLVALSRQIVLQRRLEVVADNVANLNTDGFKRQSLSFQESMMPRARTNLFERGDRRSSFVSELTTLTDFSEGSIEQTGNTFDVAIEGSGFFVVQTPEGERYTRAGNFQLDATGRLVTPDGNPVLGEGGEIVFAPNESGVIIASDGTISSSAGQRGRLRVASFPDERLLEKSGENLYSTEEPPVPALTARVRQGSLERSNVSGVTEMTRLISVTRAYEQITNVLSQHDELRGRAIERLGTLQA